MSKTGPQERLSFTCWSMNAGFLRDQQEGRFLHSAPWERVSLDWGKSLQYILSSQHSEAVLTFWYNHRPFKSYPGDILFPTVWFWFPRLEQPTDSFQNTAVCASVPYEWLGSNQCQNSVLPRSLVLHFIMWIIYVTRCTTAFWKGGATSQTFNLSVCSTK